MGVFANNLHQKTLKIFAISSLAAAVVIASGCSSDDQDEGSSLSRTSISGTVIDGYLAGATVYLDFNDNGRRNAGEPTAVTDKDGNFSTARDGTDYCAKTATAIQKTHCLSAIETGTDVVLRSYGGFDVFTGELFEGSLAVKVTVGDDGVIENKIISPLSSMLKEIDDPATVTAILNQYDLVSADLDRDFLFDDVDVTKGFKTEAVVAAITLHKVVTVFASVLDEAFGAFGEESDFPDSSNGLIYKALALQIANGSPLDNTALSAVFNDVIDDIRDLYEENEDEDFPQQNFDAIDSDTAIANATKLLSLVSDSMPLDDTTIAQAQARVHGVEMVVQKMINGAGDVDAAIAEAGDPNSALYVALDAVIADGDSDIDFSALTRIDYNQAHSFDDVDIVGATPLAGEANANTSKQLFIKYDENEDLTDEKSGSAYFFFNSDETGTSGTLAACLSYDDGDDSNNPSDDEDDNDSGDNDDNDVDVNVEETEGALIDGTWFALDNKRLILNLEGAINLMLISKGEVGNQVKYSLNYGGNTVTWLSDAGLLDELEDSNLAEQPSTSAACKTLLVNDDEIL